MRHEIQRWLVLAAFAAACATPTPTNTQSPAMSDTTRENKKIVEKMYEDCFNRGNLALLDEVISPDYTGAQGEKGPQGFKGIVAGLRSAFPDIRYEVDDLTAEGDRVAVRWRWSGTHRGIFRGFEASQKPMTNTGMAIFHLREGRVVAAKLETDRLGFFQQLGAVPPDGVLLKARTAAPAEEKR